MNSTTIVVEREMDQSDDDFMSNFIVAGNERLISVFLHFVVAVVCFADS